MPIDGDGEPTVGDILHDDYDHLPYPSMPYAQTQPARMAAIAALHGLAAPDATRARVLELGCASGGNIIPLAARFPDASFLGVDLAQRHVEQAQQRITELGLTNINVRQGDLAQIALDGDAFDYIICHGVFSWAPVAAQDGILRLCRDNLSPNGVAVVSYNVLPGWHLRSVIRDICLRHAGPEGSARQRVAKAREILAKLGEAAGKGPYGTLLRNEARRTAHRPASYILGEFLAVNNSPCHFSDFVARARAHNLAYVCEADLEASVPETLNAEMQTRLRACAGQDALAREQYVDFFTGRTLRCSILAHANTSISRARDYKVLRRLHISSKLRMEIGNGEHKQFKDARGRSISSNDPAVQQSLQRLAEAYPQTLTLEQLSATPQHADLSVEEATARIHRALSRLAAAGQVDISTESLNTGRADVLRPCAWAVARADAATGQPWITSLSHEPIPLKPAMIVLLPHLDGTNDRAQLAKIFADALRSGRVQVPELPAGEAEFTSEAINNLGAHYVGRVLDYLAANALLTPTATIETRPV